MRRLLHLTILCLSTSSALFAQNRHWVAQGASGNWSDPANWALHPGGSGGASVPGLGPGTGLGAVFDFGSSANCIVDIPVDGLISLQLRSGYLGTVIQNNSIAVNGVANSFMNVASGTFQGGASLSVVGNYTQTGGTVVLGNAANNINNEFRLSGGSFDPGPGTLTLSSSIFINSIGSLNATAGTVIIGGNTSTGISVAGAGNAGARFFNVTINKSSADDAANNFFVATGDTLIAGGTLTLLNGNVSSTASVIRVDGNANIAAGFDGALGGDLVFGGSTNGTAVFNAPWGVAAGSDIVIAKTGGGIASFTTGLGTNTITATTNTNANFIVSSGTVNFPDNDNVILNVAALTIQNQGIFTASGGTTTLTGNLNNNGVTNGNNGTFVFAGGNTTFNAEGVGVNGSATLSNVVINKTTNPGYLTIDNGDTLIATGTLTLTDGTLNVFNGGTSGVGNIQANGNFILGALFSPLNAYVHLLFGGGVQQTVSLAPAATSNINGPITFNKNPGTVVVLLSPLIADQPGQVVTFNGGVVSSSATNTFIFGTTASTAGINNGSYVDGPVRKTGTSAFTFPTGDAGWAGPVHMSGGTGFTTVLPGTSKSFVAQYFHTNPGTLYDRDAIQDPDPALKISEMEYWRVAQEGVVSPNARPFLWLSYESTRSGGISDPSGVGVAAWLGSDVWSNFGHGGVLSTGGHDYIRSGSRNFTTNEMDPVFTFITDDTIANPLPVTWLGFTGRYYNGSVELNWSTALELNNATFTVERSGDGDKYQSIGTIPGRGTVSSTSYYSFIDKEPVPGVNHYRIKQTDIDGKFSYSKEIRVSTAELGTNGLRLFPNPMTANQPLILENSEWKNQKATITIFNATGGLVQQEQVTFGADSRSRLNLSRLKKGSYFITTTLADGKKQTLSFIVQ